MFTAIYYTRFESIEEWGANDLPNVNRTRTLLIENTAKRHN